MSMARLISTGACVPSHAPHENTRLPNRRSQAITRNFGGSRVAARGHRHCHLPSAHGADFARTFKQRVPGEFQMSAPNTSAGRWGLRYTGLVMSTGGNNYVKEFTGIWRLKPDADLVRFTDALSLEVPVWGGPGRTFSEAT